MGFFDVFFHRRHRPSASHSKHRRVALYDWANPQNPEGGRKRQTARVEKGGEEDAQGGGLTPYRRLQGLSLARNLYRNSPQFRGMVRTIQNNVIGNECKLRFFDADESADGDRYRKAERYFNGVWSHHANFVDGSSFRESLKSALAALLIDGDFVCLFDDGCIKGSGKLLFFEADQIVSLADPDFAEYAVKGWSQNSGVLHDEFGREVGVIVTAKRGLTTVEKKDAFVLTRDPDGEEEAPWVLVKAHSRLNQSRGTPDSFASIQYLVDSYEALCAELQTSKLCASRFASIIEAPDEVSAPTGFDDQDEEEEEDAEDYAQDALMHYCGGNVSLFPAGTTLQMDNANRQYTNLATFLQSITDYAGQGFGLSSSYSQGKSTGSYSAARFDSLMAWRTFLAIQQEIEDKLLDFVGRHVLRFAMETGAVDELPEGWEESISWSFPRMQSLDESKDIQAAAMRIKNGLTNYAQELGPNWREVLSELSRELEFARSHGLPLNIFETAAGAPVEGSREDGVENVTEEERNDAED